MEKSKKKDSIRLYLSEEFVDLVYEAAEFLGQTMAGFCKPLILQGARKIVFQKKNGGVTDAS